MNYPYDDDDKGSTVDSPTPDDVLIETLSLAYASNHAAVGSLPSMATNSNPLTPAGIVNGAVWYEIDGGMQDWHYRYTGCIDVTLEIGTAKTPLEALIPDYWAQNREPMYAYLEGIHRGIRGIATDSVTGDPVYAKVTVANNTQPVFTDPDVGDYYRLLLPGSYTLTLEAAGYRMKTEADVIVGAGTSTELNIELEPLSLAADIDNSGQVDAADLQWVILAMLGDTIPHNADVDGNGSINAVDIQLVVNALLGK